jgi:hypothetical protein
MADSPNRRDAFLFFSTAVDGVQQRVCLPQGVEAYAPGYFWIMSGESDSKATGRDPGSTTSSHYVAKAILRSGRICLAQSRNEQFRWRLIAKMIFGCKLRRDRNGIENNHLHLTQLHILTDY